MMRKNKLFASKYDANNLCNHLTLLAEAQCPAFTFPISRSCKALYIRYINNNSNNYLLLLAM